MCVLGGHSAFASHSHQCRSQSTWPFFTRAPSRLAKQKEVGRRLLLLLVLVVVMVLLMVEYSVLPDGAHHWRTRTERWLTKAAAGQKAHRATTTTADFGANNAWNDLSDLDQSNQQRLQTAQKEVREGAVSLACICLRCIPNHRAAAVQWQNGKCLPQTHR